MLHSTIRVPECILDLTFMHNTDSDKLAEDVMSAYADFEMHFHGKGPFPMLYFKTFFKAVVRYTESIKNRLMVHRKVASAL